MTSEMRWKAVCELIEAKGAETVISSLRCVICFYNLIGNDSAASDYQTCLNRVLNGEFVQSIL